MESLLELDGGGGLGWEPPLSLPEEAVSEALSDFTAELEPWDEFLWA